MNGLKGFKGVDDLNEITETSLNDILMRMLEGDKDLDLKTHIISPINLARLKFCSDFLKMEKLPESSKLISDFITTLNRYMVSFDRLSRTEIIKAISSLLDKEQVRLTLSEKLTTSVK